MITAIDENNKLLGQLAHPVKAGEKIEHHGEVRTVEEAIQLTSGKVRLLFVTEEKEVEVQKDERKPKGTAKAAPSNAKRHRRKTRNGS